MPIFNRCYLCGLLAIVLITGCDNTLDVVDPPQQDLESAPRSTDFDTDGESLSDRMKIFPDKPAQDEPDTPVNAVPEPEATPANPFEDLSIGVHANETEQEASAAVVPLDLSKFYEGTEQQRERLDELQDAMAPKLDVENWVHSDPMQLQDLQGKIVVLDFWATWCGPCLRAVPHNNELATKYTDKGVVLIGVCAKRGAEKMEATIEKYEIEYPVAVDADGVTVKAYMVNGFPDYHIIDRTGKLRIADCKNLSVEAAIEALLAEDG